MQRLGTAGHASGGHLETTVGDAFSGHPETSGGDASGGRPGANATIGTQRTPDSLDGLR